MTEQAAAAAAAGEGGEKPATGGEGADKGAAPAKSGGENAIPAAAAAASGDFNPAQFVAALDDDGKKVWVAKGFAHPNDVLKAYTNMEKMQGGEKLPVPNAAEPEKLGEWPGWAALGVPEKADGYEIKRPDLATGIVWDEGFEKSAKDAAAMLKLTPWQLQGMADLFAAHSNAVGGQVQAVEKAQIDNVRAELASEWGAKTEANLELASAAARHYAGVTEKDWDKLDQLLGSKPLMKMMADIGGSLAEARLIGGGDSKFGGSAAQANGEIQRLEADPEFMKAVGDKHHPNHKAAVERRSRLYRLRDDPQAS